MIDEESLIQAAPKLLSELEIDDSLQDLSREALELGRPAAVYCTRGVYQRFCETPDDKRYPVYSLLGSMYQGILETCRDATSSTDLIVISFDHWIPATDGNADATKLVVQMHCNKVGTIWLKISLPLEGGHLSAYTA